MAQGFSHAVEAQGRVRAASKHVHAVAHGQAHQTTSGRTKAGTNQQKTTKLVMGPPNTYLVMGPPKGIVNLGNTCGLGSMLQAMLTSKLFRGFFLSGSVPRLTGDAASCPFAQQYYAVLDALDTIFQARHAAPVKAIVPATLFRCLLDLKPELKGNVQQDAHELLLSIFDVFNVVFLGPTRTTCRINLDMPASEAPRLVDFSCTSSLRTVDQCKGCGCTSTKVEPLRDIGIMLENIEPPHNGSGSSGVSGEAGSPTASPGDEVARFTAGGTDTPAGASPSIEAASCTTAPRAVIEEPPLCATPDSPANGAVASDASDLFERLAPDRTMDELGQAGPLLDTQSLARASDSSAPSAGGRVSASPGVGSWYDGSQTSTAVAQSSLTPNGSRRGGSRSSTHRKTSARSHTLEEALSYAVRTERITDYTCASCQTRCGSIRTMRLQRLPHQLILHTKRLGFGYKIEDHLQFSVEDPLDMAPYAATEAVGCSGQALYQLNAVIEHQGSSVGGHYVAFVQQSGTWYKCNDATVTRVTVNTVQKVQAYMLFYERISR